MTGLRGRDFDSQIQQGKLQHLGHFDYIITFDCFTEKIGSGEPPGSNHDPLRRRFLIRKDGFLADIQRLNRGVDDSRQ
jgi:hypothetical protein